jgi:hypothetical protein
MAIWYILWPFVKIYDPLVYFVVILAYFSPFWYILPREIWQPCHRLAQQSHSNEFAARGRQGCQIFLGA